MSMEKQKAVIPIVLAFVAAIVYLMALTSRERALLHDYEMADVLVAAADLPERTTINESLITAKRMPRKFVAADAFEIRTQSDKKLITNLVTRIRIPKGNQIVKSAVVSMSPAAGLSVKVPPGYRGIVVPVPKTMMDVLKPGDRVDVVISFIAEMASGPKQRVTATILQNVLVLAVGKDLGQGMRVGGEEDEDSAAKAMAFAEEGTISVALNPIEFQYLALAMDQGKLHVAVRGIGDIEMHPMQMTAMSNFFNR